jgi:hypothetical protein
VHGGRAGAEQAPDVGEHMRKSQHVLAVAGLIIAAVFLAACSASPEAAPTASAAPVDTTDWPVVDLTGTAATEEWITVPEGASSLRVHFACVGDYFTISTNTPRMDERRGSCQGTRSYLLPIPENEKMSLNIWMADESHFALTGEFSTEVFTPDPEVTAQCAQLSDFMSRYLNAEQGFIRGEVTAAEWRTRMDGAVDVITELEKTATTGLIGLEVPALVEGISAPAVVPGYFHTEREATAMDAAGTIVSDVCSDNGSGIAVMAEYGG